MIKNKSFLEKIVNICLSFVLITSSFNIPVTAEDASVNQNSDTKQQETTKENSFVQFSDEDFIVETSGFNDDEVVFFCNKEEHFHTDECYDNFNVLECEENHKHSEDCFKNYSFLTCDKKEHIHDDYCLDENYKEIPQNDEEIETESEKEFKELLNKAIFNEDNYFISCGKTEHAHTEDCFSPAEELICSLEEITDEDSDLYHIHDDSCYNKYYVIDCEDKEEHNHTIDCIEHKEELDVEEPIETEVIVEPAMDEEINHSDIPDDSLITEETPLKFLSRAPLKSKNNSISIREFFTQQFYGCKMQSGKCVWDANFNTPGHRFSFRLNYAISGIGEIDELEAVVFTIPKQILRDRNGQFAGTYEMSIPSKRDVDSGDEIDADVNFAYYEEGNNIIIYNFRPVTAGDNGYIEQMISAFPEF